MLLTVLKAFRGLVFNSSKRWDNLVVGKLPPDAADNLFNTSLCVGGGFSSKRFFASFHREIASLLSIIDWFQIVDTCNEYKLRRVTAFHSISFMSLVIFVITFTCNALPKSAADSFDHIW